MSQSPATTTTTGSRDVPEARSEQAAPAERVLLAEDVAVRDARRHVLEPTTLELRTGSLLLAVGDPGHGHTLLALALAGRLSDAEGLVSLDSDLSPALLQRSVALVDVPGVSEPDGVLTLATIAGEELAMAGRPAGRAGVRAWLEENHLDEHAETRIEELPPGVRVSALSRLAVLRPEVDFVVMVLPERHGDVPDRWLATARRLVEADFGVLVTTSLGAAHHLERHLDGPRPTTVTLGNARGQQEEEQA